MDLPPLSDASQQLMSAAASECVRRRHYYLGVEHLFVALGQADAAGLASALPGLGLDPDRFFKELMEAAPAQPHRPWGDEVVITPRAQQVLRLAAGEASRRGSARVDLSHLLEAILIESGGIPLRRLRAAGVSLTALQGALWRTTAPAPQATPALDRFGRDLTARARAGALSPVIGREKEIEQITQILLRRNKNNPVLVGEAGVGKTAVVEGLAQRLAGPDAPAPFHGARVVELSLTAMVAGTRYRGDFEERLLSVLQEAAATPGLILFLDEIHTLIGAGGGDGALDAANILKPALARGDLRCVGATTVDEYRRLIEPDAALERRFDIVNIEEPDPARAARMLDGMAGALARFHDVSIAPEAVSASLALTVRYVPQRRLPDKAIDALDQTCARVRLNQSSAPAAGTARVGAADVARTIAQWTGIPVENVSGEEASRLLRLEEDLRARVIGQDQAVAAVARAVVTARAGLADPRRPLGVFLFLGPTGVGKTELARSLAEVVLGDARRLVRFDMSEFTEPHSVAALLGAPPGYVGYEKEGRLIGALRSSPHSVLLFDEVEKAHPKIFDLFLQMFDEGRIAGAGGVTADLRQAIVILTSNLDPRPVAGREIGFTAPPMRQATPDLRAALTVFFRPELLNRIDEIVRFEPLSRDHLRRILERHFQEIAALASERGVGLVLHDDVRDWLIEKSAPEAFGARDLRRVLDRHLRQPLARTILDRGESGGTLTIAIQDDAIRFV